MRLTSGFESEGEELANAYQVDSDLVSDLLCAVENPYCLPNYTELGRFGGDYDYAVRAREAIRRFTSTEIYQRSFGKNPMEVVDSLLRVHAYKNQNINYYKSRCLSCPHYDYCTFGQVLARTGTCEGTPPDFCPMYGAVDGELCKKDDLLATLEEVDDMDATSGNLVSMAMQSESDEYSKQDGAVPEEVVANMVIDHLPFFNVMQEFIAAERELLAEGALEFSREVSQHWGYSRMTNVSQIQSSAEPYMPEDMQVGKLITGSLKARRPMNLKSQQKYIVILVDVSTSMGEHTRLNGAEWLTFSELAMAISYAVLQVQCDCGAPSTLIEFSRGIDNIYDLFSVEEYHRYARLNGLSFALGGSTDISLALEATLLHIEKVLTEQDFPEVSLILLTDAEDRLRPGEVTIPKGVQLHTLYFDQSWSAGPQIGKFCVETLRGMGDIAVVSTDIHDIKSIVRYVAEASI